MPSQIHWAPSPSQPWLIHTPMHNTGDSLDPASPYASCSVKALQDRNRKLAAERTRLQREMTAAAERATAAEGELAAAQRQIARQSDLITSLEEDLLHAGGG